MLKNLKPVLLLTGMLFLFVSVFAQQPQPLLNSKEVIAKGSKLHDDKKYKEAITLYQTISRSDTNYKHALHELAYSCYADSQFAASLKYAETGLKLFPEKKMNGMP